MLALLAASLIWAFSFGLIKTQLAGVPPHLVALLRLILSALLFAPWFRPRHIDGRTLCLLVAAGAVQYGAMYLAYLAAFAHLKASEVALWTIFTRQRLGMDRGLGRDGDGMRALAARDGRRSLVHR